MVDMALNETSLLLLLTLDSASDDNDITLDISSSEDIFHKRKQPSRHFSSAENTLPRTDTTAIYIPCDVTRSRPQKTKFAFWHNFQAKNEILSAPDGSLK